MNRIRINTSGNYQRYLMVFAALLVVILTSCPVKREIRNLFGVSISSESLINSKAHHFSGINETDCINGETTPTLISSDISRASASFSSILIFSAVLISIVSLQFYNNQFYRLSPHYKTISAPPIFLQDRKFLI